MSTNSEQCPSPRRSLRQLRRAHARLTIAMQFIFLLILAPALPTYCEATAIPGFVSDPPFNEQVLEYPFEPGVRITINAPPEDTFDVQKPTEFILYALPNGNTTEWTIGMRRREGMDWHFDIQHIGAQTRMLREASPDKNIVVAYLEAEKKSWPLWRKDHPEYAKIIPPLVMSIKNKVPHIEQHVTLTGHSGGGSFTIGYLNAFKSIPDEVDRIAFLDSNYGYSDDEQHGDKLVEWLKKSPGNRLIVLAYDDRNIMLDNKRVVGPEGGTYRATSRMIARLQNDIKLEQRTDGDLTIFEGPEKQILFAVHTNPENKILHTTMVGEMNGFIHAMTWGTSLEGKVAPYAPPRAYEKYIAEASPDVAASGADFPPRPADAITGTQFIESLKGLSNAQIEARIEEELTKGNIPDFLRSLSPVELEATGIDGVSHTGIVFVMPDYLAVGSDDDFVRMPMTPMTAQKIADAFGFTLTTRKLANDIYRQAATKLEPLPMTEDRESTKTFFIHNIMIQKQLEGKIRGALTAGTKKDVVITNRLKEKPNRVAIYGWHRLNGEPIQPLTIVHAATYRDYSHGIRLVKNMIRIDDTSTLTITEVLKDPHLCALVSDEGPIDPPSY